VNKTHQRVISTFGVLIVAENLNVSNGWGEFPWGSIGWNSIEQLEDMRDTVFSAILGYQLSEYHDPIEHIQGGVIEVNKKTIWWLDEFKTAVHRRSN
jgi:hypothetical protein